jgi:hypothetical protein
MGLAPCKKFFVKSMIAGIKLPLPIIHNHRTRATVKELSCFTIGHSNRSIDEFTGLLTANGVTCVVDVRSAPYSRRHPQFNRESIRTDLQLADIQYLYLGDSLGARHNKPWVLTPEGKVDFSRVRLMPAFQTGIDRVIRGIKKGQCITLMCAEKNPFDCHRFVLVSRELSACGVLVSHIISRELKLPQLALEQQLLGKYGLHRYQPGLFEQPKQKDELLAQAYALRNSDIAYSFEADNLLSEKKDIATLSQIH